MHKKAVYLDYNATAPMRPEAASVMADVAGAPLNPSSVHGFGRKGRAMIETARDQIAALVNCPAPQIVFNSGATEGNNTVLRHFAGERILASAIEHPSILQAGVAVETTPVTKDGIIDLNKLEEALKSPSPLAGEGRGGGASLVSLMLVN
ncbi:MAG: aminotransferase class V-fold PLP-dependent enzyme, partial [Bdellovibrionales bacterium]